MLSYMNLAVFALAACAVSPVLSAPTRYRYRNLLVEFKSWTFEFLISGIPLGLLGRIPMSFVVLDPILILVLRPT